MVRHVALVLGGGGAAGNAWEIGIIAGLAEAGIDLTEAADLVVGTPPNHKVANVFFVFWLYISSSESRWGAKRGSVNDGQ